MEQWAPKTWVIHYLDNMFDNGEDERYVSFKEMFEDARKGASDWAENYKNPEFRIRIKKVSICSFKNDKQLFYDRTIIG